MIDTPAALSAVCARIPHARRVFLDTEFHVERTYHPEPMLVQVRVDEGACELVDPRALDLRPLGDALTRAGAAGTLLVLHAGDADLRLLARIAGLAPGEVFDTQLAAALVGEGWPTRLQTLVERVTGERLPKRETLSDWSRRPLDPAQVAYAEDDVRVLPALEAALRERLHATGRLAAFRALMAERVAGWLAPAADEDAWRALGAAGRVEPEERGALQALAAWRERTARERDWTRGTVLGDAHLVDLARRRPDTLAALRDNRRFPGSIVKRDGEAILAAIARGGSAPPPESPRPWPHAWAETLRASVRASTPDVTPELVWDEAALARAHAGGAPEGWRAELLGPEGRAFAAGARALTIHGRLVPCDTP